MLTHCDIGECDSCPISLTRITLALLLALPLGAALYFWRKKCHLEEQLRSLEEVCGRYRLATKKNETSRKWKGKNLCSLNDSLSNLRNASETCSRLKSTHKTSAVDLTYYPNRRDNWTKRDFPATYQKPLKKVASSDDQLHTVQSPMVRYSGQSFLPPQPYSGQQYQEMTYPTDHNNYPVHKLESQKSLKSASNNYFQTSPYQNPPVHVRMQGLEPNSPPMSMQQPYQAPIPPQHNQSISHGGGHQYSPEQTVNNESGTDLNETQLRKIRNTPNMTSIVGSEKSPKRRSRLSSLLSHGSKKSEDNEMLENLRESKSDDSQVHSKTSNSLTLKKVTSRSLDRSDKRNEKNLKLTKEKFTIKKKSGNEKQLNDTINWLTRTLQATNMSLLDLMQAVVQVTNDIQVIRSDNMYICQRLAIIENS